MTRTVDEVVSGLKFHHQMWSRGRHGRVSIVIDKPPLPLGPICDIIVPQVEDIGCNYRQFAVVSDSCFTCPLLDCYFDNDETEVKEFIKTTICVNGHLLEESLRQRKGHSGAKFYCAACDGEDPPPPSPPDPPINTQMEFLFVT